MRITGEGAPPRRVGPSRLALVLGLDGLLFAVGACALIGAGRDDATPARRPDGFRPIPLGTRVDRAEFGLPGPGESGLTLLHFSQDRCMCSRFDEGHVRALFLRWSPRVRFVAVLPIGPGRDGRDLFLRNHPDFALCRDPEGRLARAVGVYSTPMAVILGADGEILWRGNYNTARYREAPATQFARQALEALAEGKGGAALAAVPAPYGCELPAPSGTSR